MGVRPHGRARVPPSAGVNMISKPELAATLADSLLDMPEAKFLVNVLEVVLPELVAKQDEATMREFARRMGNKELCDLLQDFARYFYTDIIFDATVDAEQKHQRLTYFTSLVNGGDNVQVFLLFLALIP